MMRKMMMDDQEPDNMMSDSGEGSEQEISVSTKDYPELEGLKNSPAKLRGEGNVTDNGDGTATFQMNSCEFETEGPATKEMKRMQGQGSNDSMAMMDNQNDGERF